MSLLKLFWKTVWHRPASMLLTLLLMGCSIGIFSIVAQSGQELEKQFIRDTGEIDLIVGAKGSPLQLVLSGIYQLDKPTGNINAEQALIWRQHPYVKRAVPLSYGDNYHDFRIVGTDTSYFKLYQGSLMQGNYWQQPMEVCLGATVAEKLGLSIGDQFTSVHGLDAAGEGHLSQPFKVTGILKASGTLIDRLIFTGLESIWLQHEIDSQKTITALLMQFQGPRGKAEVPRLINRNPELMAVNPGIEIQRLLDLFGTGFTIVKAIGSLLLGIAAISIFLTLLERLRRRKYEFALMRVMGASPTLQYLLLSAEGAFIGCLGWIVGIGLGKLGSWSVTLFVANTYQFDWQFFSIKQMEWILLLITVGMGLCAAILPGFFFLKKPLSDTLSDA